MLGKNLYPYLANYNRSVNDELDYEVEEVFEVRRMYHLKSYLLFGYGNTHPSMFSATQLQFIIDKEIKRLQFYISIADSHNLLECVQGEIINDPRTNKRTVG
jgi:hypothetical protein